MSLRRPWLELAYVLAGRGVLSTHALPAALVALHRRAIVARDAAVEDAVEAGVRADAHALRIGVVGADEGRVDRRAVQLLHLVVSERDLVDREVLGRELRVVARGGLNDIKCGGAEKLIKQAHICFVGGREASSGATAAVIPSDLSPGVVRQRRRHIQRQQHK